MNEYKITYPDWRRPDFHEWWQYRELFWFLAWRDIKVKYKQTLIGIGWAVLQPLSLMILFTLLWKWVIPVDTGVPYPVFVYSGLILWELFSSGINNAGTSMINQAHVIKKVYFPRILVPTSAMLVSLLDFCITLIFYVALLIFYGVKISLPVFAFFSVAAFLIALTAMLGCGLILAAINIRYRDARHAIPFLLRLLFFATPVIFPLAVVKSETLLFILSLNPMAAAIHLARVAISVEGFQWQFAVAGLGVSILMLLIGLSIFNKNEINCADVL